VVWNLEFLLKIPKMWKKYSLQEELQLQNMLYLFVNQIFIDFCDVQKTFSAYEVSCCYANDELNIFFQGCDYWWQKSRNGGLES